MRSKRAFTLIELLVVIAIIGLLLAIIMPALKKAKSYSQKISCQNNLHQFGIAMSIYESEYNYTFRNFKSAIGMTSAARRKHWFTKEGGTGDYSHEDMPNAVRDIMNAGLLPDRKIFFCPGLKNLDYDQNYPYSEAVDKGILKQWKTDDIYEAIKNGTLPATSSASGGINRPVFWGTYVWLWKKEMQDPAIKRVNNLSSGVLMVDITRTSWNYSYRTNLGGLGKLLESIDITRSYYHGNALMQDYSVENPTDQEDELVDWLWGPLGWLNDPAYPAIR